MGTRPQLVMTVALIWTAVMTPFEVGVLPLDGLRNKTHPIYVVNQLTNVIFMCDIYVTFHLAFAPFARVVRTSHVGSRRSTYPGCALSLSLSLKARPLTRYIELFSTVANADSSAGAGHRAGARRDARARGSARDESGSDSPSVRAKRPPLLRRLHRHAVGRAGRFAEPNDARQIRHRARAHAPPPVQKHPRHVAILGDNIRVSRQRSPLGSRTGLCALSRLCSRHRALVHVCARFLRGI